MSKYIKEWLFCESGDAYKLPDISSVFKVETLVTPRFEYFVIFENAKEYRIEYPDYIEIINALKEREQAIANLLDMEDKTNPFWQFAENLRKFGRQLEDEYGMKFNIDENVDLFIRSM